MNTYEEVTTITRTNASLWSPSSRQVLSSCNVARGLEFVSASTLCLHYLNQICLVYLLVTSYFASWTMLRLVYLTGSRLFTSPLLDEIAIEDSNSGDDSTVAAE